MCYAQLTHILLLGILHKVFTAPIIFIFEYISAQVAIVLATSLKTQLTLLFCLNVPSPMLSCRLCEREETVFLQLQLGMVAYVLTLMAVI